MLKFDGYVFEEHKKNGSLDEKWFVVKALSEKDAKLKITLEYASLV